MGSSEQSPGTTGNGKLFAVSMEKQAQISATVSATTKELLDRHVRATGVKRGRLIEQALLHYLQALHELPADVIVYPKIVVTRESGEAILKEIESGEPSKALRDLMADGD
jgi:Ribbon-helix-helix protein, copG family